MEDKQIPEKFSGTTEESVELLTKMREENQALRAQLYHESLSHNRTYRQIHLDILETMRQEMNLGFEKVCRAIAEASSESEGETQSNYEAEKEQGQKADEEIIEEKVPSQQYRARGRPRSIR